MSNKLLCLLLVSFLHFFGGFNIAKLGQERKSLKNVFYGFQNEYLSDMIGCSFAQLFNLVEI